MADERIYSRSEVVARVDGREYTLKELEAAFALVEPSTHWKDPINAVVPVDADLDAIRAAVEFYTATAARTWPVANGYGVRADGYRLGPAGDH